jgi:GT2 family glycosyltransferase/ADP-heptose:LPS heptosyltransferase
MSAPVVYAIIINFNGWPDTVECLESVYRSDYPALRVLILDNASTDGSLDRLRDWAATLTGVSEASRPTLMPMGANLGFAGANNVGLQYLLTRESNAYAWLLNNDTIVAPDAIRRMVEMAERDATIGAVGATLLQYGDPERLETAGGGTFGEWHGMIATIRGGAMRGAPRSAPGRIDFISGTCILVPRRTVERVGLMDERYFLYGEDIDWGARIRESGLRLAYCADAEVWHKGGGSIQHGSALHDYYCVKSSLLLVHKRNPVLLPLALAYSAARCVFPKAIRGDWRRLRAVVRGYVDFARQVAGGAAAKGRGSLPTTRSFTGARRRGTPLRGRYLVKHRLWNAWLRANDYALELFSEPRIDPLPPPKTPKRVLLAVGGQLGDAVIATSVLAPLRSMIPGVEIGVLCGSWSRPIFSAHPAIRHVHTMDHWKLDRSSRSLPARWLVARRTRTKAIAEIRAANYDAAIDLSAYFPNSARLLRRAGVPVRVGFTSGGDGSLYTHPVSWTPGRHVTGDHLALLTTLLPQIPTNGVPAYEMPEPPADAVAGAQRLLAAEGITPDDYVVVHVGASIARKEWPLAKWRAVVRQIVAAGNRVVLTGAGARQAALTRDLSAGTSGVVDFCDRLKWEELRCVLKRARLVVSVDTVAMHLAAAEGTPCVALMTAMDDPQRWRPLGEQVTLLTAPVPCAPCYRSRGCAAMSCIRDLTPELVLAAASPHLNGR